MKDDSCSCSLRCHTCGVCVHIFMCTCMDFILHATVCKHIHFIKVHLDSIWTPEGESSVLVETTSVWEDEKSNAPMQFTVEPNESCSAIVENDNPDISSVHCNVFKQSQHLLLLGIEQYHYVRRLRLHYLIAQIWMPLQQDQNT